MPTIKERIASQKENELKKTKKENLEALEKFRTKTPKKDEEK